MIFISYSRKDCKMVKKFADLLKARGIKVWQDIESLPKGEEVESGIEEGIKNTVGMVTFWTPNSLESKAVLHEYKFGNEEAKNRSEYFQIPILVNCSIDDLKDKTGLYISKNNARIKKRSERQGDFLRQAANDVLHRICQNLNPEIPINLGIYTKVKAPKNSNNYFSMDFFELVNGEKERCVDNWQQVKEAIEDFYQVVVQYTSAKKIIIDAYCDYSTLILFGYTFHYATNFHLIIDQNGEIWDLKAQPSSDLCINQKEEKGEFLNEENILLGVTCLHPMEETMLPDIPYRLKAMYSPVDSQTKNIKDKLCCDEALRFAQDIRKELIKVRNKAQTLHLFVAVPKGLALMIGHNLNTMSPIQLYDFDKQKREYFPTIAI